jgi:hypothetical protein
MSTNEVWTHTYLNAWLLVVEASSVIALRMLKLAEGGAAAKSEALRMVNEKIESGLTLQALALTGGLGLTPLSASSKTLAHYQRRVHANKRRLTKE